MWFFCLQVAASRLQESLHLTSCMSAPASLEEMDKWLRQIVTEEHARPRKVSKTGRDSNPSCTSVPTCVMRVADSLPTELWLTHVRDKEVTFLHPSDEHVAWQGAVLPPCAPLKHDLCVITCDQSHEQALSCADPL